MRCDCVARIRVYYYNLYTRNNAFEEEKMKHDNAHSVETLEDTMQPLKLDEQTPVRRTVDPIGPFKSQRNQG
jgi:hypothetical protein